MISCLISVNFSLSTSSWVVIALRCSWYADQNAVCASHIVTISLAKNAAGVPFISCPCAIPERSAFSQSSVNSPRVKLVHPMLVCDSTRLLVCIVLSGGIVVGRWCIHASIVSNKKRLNWIGIRCLSQRDFMDLISCFRNSIASVSAHRRRWSNDSGKR